MKTLYDAMLDPELFGKTFGGPTFESWRTVAKMLDGLPMTDTELALYQKFTARKEPPTEPFNEIYLIKPRRAGGTLFGAACGLHAALQDYRSLLGPGEVATTALIASDRRQARQLMNYVQGLIEESPIISAELVKKTTETVEFAHRSVIEVHTGSFRSTRGYSFACVLLDELAFYRDDMSAIPDIELVRAVRPGLTNLKGRLLAFSSPHARRGHLWNMYRTHYGEPSAVLVIKAGGPALNPTIDEAVIRRAREEDPIAARSEWDAEFRPDIAAFLDDDLNDTAIVPGRRELPVAGHGYFAFVDPSGGRHDAMVLSIVHREGDRVVQDLVMSEKPPFVPDDVVERFCEAIKRYRLSSVTGDRYAAEWVSGSFAKHGISYIAATKDKSSLYIESLPLFTAQKVELLDVPKLATELRLLERRARAGGRGDIVDHPPRGTDDIANASCGSLWLAASESAEDSQVFPSTWIRQAQARWQPSPMYYAPVCSLGVVRTPNQTLIATRRDGWFAEFITAAVTAAPDVAGFVVSNRRDNAIVIVDVEAGNGVDICGHLKTNGIEVKGFRGQVQSRRRTADKQLPFSDKLTEACWRFREALGPEQPGGSPIQLPNDPELVADLTAFAFSVTAKGIEVRQHRPAPRAEALLLAYAYGPTAKTILAEWRPDQRDGFIAPKKQVKANFRCRIGRARRRMRHQGKTEYRTGQRDVVQPGCCPYRYRGQNLRNCLFRY